MGNRHSIQNVAPMPTPTTTALDQAPNKDDSTSAEAAHKAEVRRAADSIINDWDKAWDKSGRDGPHPAEQFTKAPPPGRM